jgi:membrane-bound lytic murein transglycosylase A
VLSGQELVWLENPVDAYFAHVQGSVRVRLDDGGTLRLGVAARNGHPYRSIGAELIRMGDVPEAEMSACAIRRWCAANPKRMQALFNHNPSYIFFRILDLPEDSGPIGSAGVPLTPLRSLAVDPAHVPLGSPVWVESFGPERLSMLMIAQDTGSAITGPGRGDVFFGSGAAAGERAGRMKERCRLTVLLPGATP